VEWSEDGVDPQESSPFTPGGGQAHHCLTISLSRCQPTMSSRENETKGQSQKVTGNISEAPSKSNEDYGFATYPPHHCGQCGGHLSKQKGGKAGRWKGVLESPGARNLGRAPGGKNSRSPPVRWRFGDRSRLCLVLRSVLRSCMFYFSPLACKGEGSASAHRLIVSTPQ
jgi:hypothetical protein